jgi:hypothetical protein
MTALIPARAELLLVCPKAVPAEWWYSPELQREVGFLHVLFPADPRLSDAVRLLAPTQGVVLFVGDMDPVAIAQYLATQRMLAEAGGPQLTYGGMNDEWLAAMRRSKCPLARLSIRMSRPEMRLLRAIETEVRLDELLGPDSARLLQSGSKVELEAGLNPAIHGAAHRRRILGYLRKVAAEPADSRGANLVNGRRTRG